MCFSSDISHHLPAPTAPGRDVANARDADNAGETTVIFNPGHPMQLDFLQQKNPPVFKMDREGFPSCPLFCWDLQPSPCEIEAQIREHLNLRGDHVGWQAGQGGGQSAGVPAWHGSVSGAAAACFPGEAPFQGVPTAERREEQLFG